MYGFPTETGRTRWTRSSACGSCSPPACIQSGYWHRFAATAHSPMACIRPLRHQRCGARAHRVRHKRRGFHESVGADHDFLGTGLRKALYNYNARRRARRGVRTWFEPRRPSGAPASAGDGALGARERTRDDRGAGPDRAVSRLTERIPTVGVLHKEASTMGNNDTGATSVRSSWFRARAAWRRAPRRSWLAAATTVVANRPRPRRASDRRCSRALADAPGRTSCVELKYAPNSKPASTAEQHPLGPSASGSVYVYVTEGAVRSAWKVSR